MKIHGKPKELKGKVSFHRTNSALEDDYATIELTDELSGCYVVRIKMTIAEFGVAILGLSSRPCEFELYTGPIGKKSEHKEVAVMFPTGFEPAYNAPYEDFAEVLKPYLVDGWQVGNPSDLTNSHRWINPGGENRGQRVGFIRYVDVETK